MYKQEIYIILDLEGIPVGNWHRVIPVIKPIKRPSYGVGRTPS